MNRDFNSTRDDFSFNEATIEAVWRKGIPESDYSGFRKDKCGASMQRIKYGKTEEWGWEIDHIKPVAENGTDDMDNLQPLQWENNRSKGNDYPKWTCRVKQ